jgi:hypothetical protein
LALSFSRLQVSPSLFVKALPGTTLTADAPEAGAVAAGLAADGSPDFGGGISGGHILAAAQAALKTKPPAIQALGFLSMFPSLNFVIIATNTLKKREKQDFRPSC